MSFNSKGRFYTRGKCLDKCVRGDIIDDILKAGGDSRTGYFPGHWTTIGAKYRIHSKTVKSIWETFVSSGSVSPRKPISGNPSKLGANELQLIEAIKTQRPSISYKHVRNNVLQHGNLPSGTSTSAIGRAVRSSMIEGAWTWRRMCRTVKNKFTPENVNYAQDFLNFISQVDPYRLKFFDEMGVNMNDCNKRYGHSLKNTPCIEVGRFMKSPNITLNFLGGLDGVMYANTVNGASDTVEFLNFFAEASRSFQPDGNPVLMAGDIIVLDNCPTHHNAGSFALGQWLDTLGIDVDYLPTYSPEMNPVELVFQKLKVVLKREELEPLITKNLHAALYFAMEEITPHDLLGFYRHSKYIFV